MIRVIIRAFVFFSCSGVFSTSSAQTPSFITDSLDSYIERGMKQWEIPGLSIAIVKDGKLVAMKGYGVREKGKAEKVDENSTDYNGSQVYWHTGGAFGHVTNVCFVPEAKLGITILTNNDNQSFFEALRYQILDAYLGVPYTDRSKFQWGFFAQNKKTLDAGLASLKNRVDKKNLPGIKLEDFTGDYFNTVYGKISISKNGNSLVCAFQHHPELTGTMEYMDNNEFMITYSNIGYGIHPAKFSLKEGKPVAVEIRVNEFVESDAYLFVKDPQGLMVK